MKTNIKSTQGQTPQSITKHIMTFDINIHYMRLVSSSLDCSASFRYKAVLRSCLLSWVCNKSKNL